MIYNWHSRVLIVTPPKAASSSLHQSLAAFHGYAYIASMTCWGGISKHCAISELGNNTSELFDLNNQKLKILLAIRNPVDRIISMYRHQVRFDGFKGGFEQWVEHHENKGDAARYWHRSCCAHVELVDPDRLIRTESLNDDLVKHHLPPIHGWVNRTTKRVRVKRDQAESVSRQWWPDDWEHYDS